MLCFRDVMKESASDVERRYTKDIASFLREFSGNPTDRVLVSSRRKLSDLFDFTRDLYQTKTRLASQTADLTTRLNASQADATLLQNELESAHQIIGSKEDTIRQRDRDLATAYDRRVKDLAAADDQREKDLTTANNRRVKDLAAANDRWGEILEEANRRHEQEVNNLRAQHAIRAAEFQARIDRLLDDIMYNQADSRAWTDEKLKQRLGDLQREISELTSPRAVATAAGAGRGITSAAVLDKHGFLGREGAETLFLLLRSVFWDILAEHFFSMPFGFGALGPGEGKTALLGVYRAWRALFDGPRDPGEDESSYVAVFVEDPEASKWRSSTFEGLMAAVLEDRSAQSGHAMSASWLRPLYKANIKKAAERMEWALADGTGQDRSRTTKKQKEMFLKVARLAAELGLQVGVQASRVELNRPARQQAVVIGDEFHHWRDQDMDRGQRVKVDLVVSPGLVRLPIGDEATADGGEPVVLVPSDLYYPAPDGGVNLTT